MFCFYMNVSPFLVDNVLEGKSLGQRIKPGRGPGANHQQLCSHRASAGKRLCHCPAQGRASLQQGPWLLPAASRAW